MARACGLVGATNTMGCPVLAIFALVGAIMPTAPILRFAKSHRGCSIVPSPFQQA